MRGPKLATTRVDQVDEVLVTTRLLEIQVQNLVPARLELKRKLFHRGKKRADLLDVVFDVASLICQLGDDIEDAGILLLEPAVPGAQLIAQGSDRLSQRFHRLPLFQ